MSTPHNEANIGEIANDVIMPGDPLRAKYIAEKFLTDYKLVNKVRGMYAYTGKYKGKDVTVMAHGMGMPSIGIYCYELFKFYGVNNIIRIGSAGAISSELNLFDLVLTSSVYTESNFALALNNEDCHFTFPSSVLNDKIISTAHKNSINLILGNTVTSDAFDEYMTDRVKFLNRLPSDFNPVSVEMEAFALLYTAKMLNKNASCLMTIVDVLGKGSHATSEERENGLNNMILLALESIL